MVSLKANNFQASKQLYLPQYCLFQIRFKGQEQSDLFRSVTGHSNSKCAWLNNTLPANIRRIFPTRCVNAVHLNTLY